MTLKNAFTFATIIGLLLVTALAIAFTLRTDTTKASSYPGQAAVVATSSTASVGTTASALFATSTCVARTISASTTPLRLQFGANQGRTPSATVGILQLASTTVVYDSGQFGCGQVLVWSPAADTISIQEAQ